MEYQHAVAGRWHWFWVEYASLVGVGMVWFWCVLLVLGTLLGPGATGVVLVIVPPAAGSRTGIVVGRWVIGGLCGDGGGGCCLGTA